MKKKITDYFLYKQRYIISLTIAILILVLTLLFAGIYSPGGLAESEIESSISSHQLGFANIFDAHNTPNLPFNLLQKLSINLFGLSNFSIKLPSLILTLLAAIALFGLIKIWTSYRNAILSTIMIVVSSRWLFLSQLGDAQNSLICLAVILASLLAFLAHKTNQIFQAQKQLDQSDGQKNKGLLILGLCLLAVFIVVINLFYFKNGVYLILVISLSMLLHPFMRLSLKRLNSIIGKHWYIIGIICLLVGLAPLIISVIKNYNTALLLLDINNLSLNILNNLQFLVRELLDFSPSHGLFAIPWFSLSAVVLIVIGLFREVKTSYKPRGAIILTWLGAGLVLNVFSQNSGVILFVPLALSLAMGLDYIITSWYRIFPRNPIARTLGLLPIAITIFSLMFYSITNYSDAYMYQPELASSFSNDLKILQTYIRNNHSEDITLITDESRNEFYFYEILAQQNSRINISTTFTKNSQALQIATRAARDTTNDIDIERILTSHFKDDADRFYVYKKVEK